ncbi:Rad52/Rad22 family DNA repair protein, partial [Moraxella catarrhalis]|uniref:Rad52/Rad22 family DNA repair protein n=1 Tax=Moraxella catarrhalis TaxID=480 RepID=UPI0019532742
EELTGDTFEHALKGAATDALKRCCKLIGKAFGLLIGEPNRDNFALEENPDQPMGGNAPANKPSGSQASQPANAQNQAGRQQAQPANRPAQQQQARTQPPAAQRQQTQQA